MQAPKQTQSSRLTTLPKLRSPWLKLPPSNPKLPHDPLWLCAVMTVQAKNALKPHPLAVVAMADVTVVAKASHLEVHVWAMRRSVRNVMRWNRHKMLCVA